MAFSMSANPLVLLALAIGVGTGALIDLRTRRVPNVLTVTLAAAGIGGAVTGLSGLTLTASFFGLTLGLLLMLPGHFIGATGAGDVKLFAAAGTLIGPVGIVMAFLYTALAGGALALIIATLRRRLALTLDNTSRIAMAGAAPRDTIEHPEANNRFAYAPAIAVGTLLAALGL